jgi:uncharacterized membrane protein
VFRRYGDLAAAVVYAAGATAAVLALDLQGVVGLLLAPLLLVCPGYTLVRALEGRRRLDVPELVTATVVLSLATVALAGLELNAYDLRLTARAWSISMLVVTVVAAVAAAARRAGAHGSVRRRSSRLRALPLLAGVAACVLVAAAAAVADRSQRSLDRRTSVTTLGVARSHDRARLRISVVNAEPAAGRYRVLIEAGARWTGFSLTLKRGESWSASRHMPASGHDPVTVRLFRATGSGTLIRTVTLQ